jgi:hypothetical protein
LTAEDFRTVQTPRFPYLLIPAVAIGFLAACGSPEPTEPVDPAAPESARLEPFEMQLNFPIEGPGPFDQHRIMNGHTAVLSTLESHFSILQGGKSSHAPHKHVAEEIIFPFQGDVEIYRGPWKEIAESKERIGPGQFIFHASGHLHAMSAVGPEPSGYWVMQWAGGPTGADEQILPPSTFDYSTPPAIDAESGVGSRVLADSQTPNVKRLVIQTMALAPGADFHIDSGSHDTVIMTVTGGLQISGQAVEAHTLLLRPAGDELSIANAGQEAAQYVSFEYYR